MNHKTAKLTLASFPVEVSLAIFLIMNDSLNWPRFLQTSICYIGMHQKGGKHTLEGNSRGELEPKGRGDSTPARGD